MTLLELAVVLLVLIGLAGMLLPYVGGFGESTRTSTSSDTLVEVNKAIDTYYARFSRYPDNWNSLYDGTSIITWLPDASNAVPAEFTTVDLSSDAAAVNIIRSLQRAGITRVWRMATKPTPLGNFNATFNYYTSATTPVSIANSGYASTLVRLTPSAVGTIVRDGMGVPFVPPTGVATHPDLTATPNNYYMVFGVGPQNSMAGSTIKELPTYFSGGVENPIEYYCRFLTVFRVPLSGTGNVQLMGTMTPTRQTLSQIATAHFERIRTESNQ